MGVTLQSQAFQNRAALNSVYHALTSQPPDSLLVLGDPLTVGLRADIASFAIRQRLPAVYPFREFVDVGGLMSYGANLNDLFRRIGRYIDKILNGSKPSDLPVELPTKFDLIINLKTANTIGLTIPTTLLALADEVIE
jgi:putative tryptophan/tyrosine transport system substrate-binding protein